jgi:hypothetical protein
MLLDEVRVGVSSRAVGSVEEKFGTLIVGDDLELIGWDDVLEPSTSNAWIGNDMSELQQYIESDETRRDKELVSEKLKRVKSILL